MVKLLFSGATSSAPRGAPPYPYPYNTSQGIGVGGWNLLGADSGSIVKSEGSCGGAVTAESIVAAATSPMLVSATPRQPPPHHHLHQQHQQQPQQRQQAKKSDPSTCMFWCAVALGGLSQGQPIQNVSDRRAVRLLALRAAVPPPGGFVKSKSKQEENIHTQRMNFVARMHT